jgi:hypothetical protein
MKYKDKKIDKGGKMTAKKNDLGPGSPGAPAEGSGDKRKPWVKKDAAESMLSLIQKQEERVAKMRKELEKEEKQLEKLQKAKKVLEAT